MKKTITALTSIALFLSCTATSQAQLRFIDTIPYGWNISLRIEPNLRVFNDTLYLCTESGLYIYDLENPGKMELAGFAGVPTLDMVKDRSSIMVLGIGSSDGTDSLLFYSEDKGKTFCNHTPPELIDTTRGFVHPQVEAITQNPLNPSRWLIFLPSKGFHHTFNHGSTWERAALWYPVASGVPCSQLTFHPLDTTLFYLTGESTFQLGMIMVTDTKIDSFFYYETNSDSRIYNTDFHPNNAGSLIYCDLLGSVGFSSDTGKTWKSTYRHSGLQRVFFNPVHPDTLYAISKNGQGSLQILASSNGGRAWKVAFESNATPNTADSLYRSSRTYDFLLYRDRLFIYTSAGLFEMDMDALDIPERPDVLTERSKSNSIRIYPNPARETIWYMGMENVQRIEILDMSGRLVKTIMQPSENRIDITDISPGLYVVGFYGINGYAQAKMIVATP